MWMDGTLMLALAAGLCICLGLCALYFYRRSRSEKSGRDEAVKETAAALESAGIFERMVPKELLRLLKIKDYSELKVGAQQYFSAVIMDVNKADFSGVVHNKEVEEVFASINTMLGKVIPIVYGRGGLVDSFDKGGISALFPGQEEDALSAAVSICEEINAMGGQEYETVAAGMASGSVMIGVVGHEERMTILLLSEAQEFAGFLRSIGHRYYARILVAKDILDAMGERAGRFNYRTLGKIYIRSMDVCVTVCDVFDGDRVQIRNRKRKTRIVFEKGVELYWTGQLKDARQHFVEVLKMDTADRAAAFYLLRCDECLNSGREWTEYIECY